MFEVGTPNTSDHSGRILSTGKILLMVAGAMILVAAYWASFGFLAIPLIGLCLLVS